MTKAWSGSSDYRHLAAELATADERDFERRALPLLRLVWPSAVGTPKRRRLDQSGVDAMVWSDTQPYPVVVQSKGFQVGEDDLGQSQIRQCVQSIEAFQKSRLRTKQYVLLHNRLGADASFRGPIENALSELETTGAAARAELWNRQRLLRESFNATLGLLRARIRSTNLSHTAEHLDTAFGYELVPDVPLRRSHLTADQYRLLSSTKEPVTIADPVAEILGTASGGLCIVIGEAGYGKTLAALRAVLPTNRRAIYMPGAAISESIVSTNDLLYRCVRLDDVFDDLSDEDRPSAYRVARSVIAYLLKDEKTPVTLILDGLDESVFVTRRGGIQWLFNLLRPVRVPVILLMRSEFWHLRNSDFSSSFGAPARRKAPRYQSARLIELLPWGNREILQLSQRHYARLSDDVSRKRVHDFIQTIIADAFAELYGDIPRRPLFLAFLLDWIAEYGTVSVSRLQLVSNAVRMKISRDLAGPAASGGTRLPIVADSEGGDATAEMAWLAMKIGAGQMTSPREGILELLPSCPLEKILAQDRRLGRIVDPAGLVLNTLLIPVPSRLPEQPLQVQFAHRLFQEFFLAQFIHDEPGSATDLQIPPAVAEWLRELQV